MHKMSQVLPLNPSPRFDFLVLHLARFFSMSIKTAFELSKYRCVLTLSRL